jgi:GNAT superfamily N-acetyltransferase
VTFYDLTSDPKVLEDAGVLWAAFCMEKGEADPDVEYWVEQLRMLLEKGMAFGFVVEEDGEPIALAEGVLVYEAAKRRMAAHGRTVFVLPSHRGNGLAAEIGKRMLGASIERGARDVVVHGDLIPKLLDRAVDKIPGEWDHYYRVSVK